MSDSKHIPRSPALLGLTVTELVLALIELGLLGLIQWDINYGAIGRFKDFPVLPGGTGVGLFVSCHSVVWAIYYLMTTRKIFRAYYRPVALFFVLGGAIFWLVTWGMYTNVLTLLKMAVPSARCVSNCTRPDQGYELLGINLDDGIWGTVLAIAIVEWIMFVASTVLIFRAPRQIVRQQAV